MIQREYVRAAMKEARVEPAAGTLLDGRKVPTLGEALAQQAYELLRDAIVNQQIPAGARLSVPDLARQLGISRSPVREAIARLVNDRLAIAEARRGAVVADITRGDLMEIYALREVLEGLACRLAAERITDSELDELDQIIIRHKAAIGAGDVGEHMTVDQLFHALIRNVTRSDRLIDNMERLQGQIRMAMDTTRRSVGGMEQAVSEHEEILAALRQRDPVLAERVGRRHIERLQNELAASDAGTLRA